MKQLKKIVEERGMTFDEASKRYDQVNHPPHYNNGGIECIDYIKQQLGSGFKNYLIGSIIKYVHRHEYKDQNIQDLQKARWYLDKLIDYYENL